MKSKKKRQLERDLSHLQSTVRILLKRIEENFTIQTHFRKAEFRLLEVDTISEFLHEVLNRFQFHFKFDQVSLVFLDKDSSISRLLDHLRVNGFEDSLSVIDDASFFENYFPNHKPLIGPAGTVDYNSHVTRSPDIKSIVDLPLIHRNTILGSLHIGSLDESRFRADQATDFLEHLAKIVCTSFKTCMTSEHLRLDSEIDVLSQVNNRRSFDKVVLESVSKAIQSGEHLSCVFVDLDHFKNINDTLGHQTGDDCIYGVAQRTKMHLKKTDFIARYGGEEFVLLLSNTDVEQALNVAEKIRLDLLNTPIETKHQQQQSVSVTASLGVSTFNPINENKLIPEDVARSLVDAADQGVYKAKESGRNQTCVVQYPRA